jgi:hypothetical protein
VDYPEPPPFIRRRTNAAAKGGKQAIQVCEGAGVGQSPITLTGRAGIQQAGGRGAGEGYFVKASIDSQTPPWGRFLFRQLAWTGPGFSHETIA